MPLNQEEATQRGARGKKIVRGRGRKVGTSEGPPESRKRKSYSDSDSGGDDGSDPAPDPSPFF